MPDILTLDVGTTALKAVVFDEDGRLRGRAECEYQLDRPRPGWLELDPEVYWEAAARAIRQVVETAAPVAPCAVGVTSQGETLIVLDGQGRPLRPAIVWLDTRSDREARDLEQALDPAAVYRRTGQSEIIPAWPATRIAWLQRHEPEVFRRAARYLLVADYLIYRLTGGMVSDRGMNPSTFYYDLTGGCWWDEMLSRLGLTPAQLPDLVGPGGPAGLVTPAAAAATGLPAGLPVISAPIDQVCAALGAGNIRPGVITENTGAALALAVTLDEPLFDPQRRMGLYTHGLPGKYMLLPWAPTAGMALRWLRDELGGGWDYAALCRPAAAVPPGADDLLVLPHFSGAGCPRVAPAARGVFWGLTLNHGRAHLVRALLESVAFMLRGNLEMLGGLGVATGELCSLGGASRSDLWLQIKADVCRSDLLTMECAEATSLGVALLAAVAAGIHSNHASAAAAMVRESRRVRHDPAVSDIYDRIFLRYRHLEDTALEMFAKNAGFNSDN